MATTLGNMASDSTNDPALSGPEPAHVSGARNSTLTDYPRDRSVHELFVEIAACAPDVVALQSEGEQLTFRQLNERSNQLARHLQKSGVGREVMVAICLERSIAMIVTILATLKAGGAYVPLDISYPRDRLAFMLEDMNAPITITQESLIGKFDFCGNNVTTIEQALRASDAESKENLGNTGSATDLAYVMYTSGSAGQPKGVMVEHRSIVRLVKKTDFIDISPDDVFLQLAPISFDASTLEIWAPLLNGARLAIMPPQTPSLEDIGNAIRRCGVTTLWLTAGLFNLMVEQQLTALGPLRQLLAGGDVLSPLHVRQAANAHPQCKIINGYGPTENTTFTCCHTVGKMDLQAGSIPIGRPISNTRVYLLDPQLKPVQVGETGELCAGGDGVARGYLNRPDLTAEKFVADPFNSDPGARMYRTGDLARCRPDGVIEFVGRTDWQVKVAGNRIELGEIEAVLQAHEQVKMAVVAVREDRPREKKIVAYVIPRNNEETMLPSKLRVDLQEKLPAFMIPTAIVVMDSFPLSPNGKVDRGLLPPPGVPNPGPNVAGARNEIQEAIAQAWKTVLNIQEAGLDTNFFDLGGDSLQLIEVHARVQKALNVELSITDLFEYSTIASLARHLGAKAPEKLSFSEAQRRAFKQKAAIERQKELRAHQGR
jgi:amino acid adenylation domain-containing protein